MDSVLAHGIGGVQDLPIPRWLFLIAAAAVLVVSFGLLGALWQQPLLARRADGRPLGAAFSRFVLAPLRRAVQVLSVVFFALVWAAALTGNLDPYENLAPTWVYVIFWLGLPLLSVVFGNVWRALSPWRALADGFVWAWERAGRRAAPLAVYPAWAGRWPAAAALLAFVSLELAYSEPSNPRALGFAIALYTYVALFGMAAVGRDTWERNGEGFAVAFGLLARIAPLHTVGGRVRLRWPLTGLAGDERAPGTVAVVAVMLGSVIFDGYSRRPVWQDALASVEGPFLIDRPGLGEVLVTLASLGGLIVASLLVGLAYVSACAISRSVVDEPRTLVPDFLLSLVPVAFVYVVAHYFTYFIIQGQYAIPLLADPFGHGWNLFGAAGYLPDLAPFATNTIWYVQVGALVVGHVAGLAVAHDRAVEAFIEPRAALRSQFALLALMATYTVAGLWVLSGG